MAGHALVASSLALALQACHGAQVPFVYPAASVILISIDTLRADHLPVYGYQAGATPALDALARDGVVFEDVYSHCPLTLPAHASLLTGLLPPRHGVRDNLGFSLEQEHSTLATRFKRAGLRTGGAVSAFVLRSQTGIGQGFDFFDDALEEPHGAESAEAAQRDGASAVDVLARWLQAQGNARFFAFLHLYEPHTPYTPPERYRRLKPYDGEIAYADELVGRFLKLVEGNAARAIVAVTSDHGEGLGDHGESEHGIFLYRESLHVPLIVRLPGRARGGARIAGTVAQVDVAATLLDLAGLPTAGVDGISLRSAIAGVQPSPRPVYSETFFPRYHFGWSELLAVSEGRLRYIRSPRAELYDIRSDPGEKGNVIAARAAVAERMDAWLSAFGSSTVAVPTAVSAETRERLRSLGYLGSDTERARDVARVLASAPGGSLPDPKDKIGVYEDLKQAVALRGAARDAEAAEILKRVVAQDPALVDAWELLGLSLLGAHRLGEGVAALEQALRLDPDRVSTHMALGRAYRERGEASRALASYRRAEEAGRKHGSGVPPGLHSGLGDSLALLGRAAEAEREFLAEIQALPASEEGRVGLAMLYRSEGRDDEARAVLLGLITASAHPSADAYETVIQAFSGLGDTTAAREWTVRARERFPQDPRFR